MGLPINDYSIPHNFQEIGIHVVVFLSIGVSVRLVCASLGRSGLGRGVSPECPSLP